MSSRVALLAGLFLLVIARFAVAAEALVPPGESLNGWATVVAAKTGVHLRAAADAPVVLVARKDDEFVLDEPFLFGDRWIRVRTPDGRVGWIAREDLRPGRVGLAKSEPAGGTRGLLPEEKEEAAAAAAREPKLPIVRDPLPPWRARVQVEYGFAYVRQENVIPGPNDVVDDVRRAAGLRGTAVVRDPVVIEAAWTGVRDLREHTRQAGTVEELDRMELSAGWRDVWGSGKQVSLTLLAGLKRDRLRVQRETVVDPLAPPAAPAIAQHDATLSGFRLEYGFLGNRLVAEVDARHQIGRRTKGYTWGGGLRGRHASGIEAGIAYHAAWHWQEREDGLTFAHRHVVSAALGKSF